jgi:hypothetical protein
LPNVKVANWQIANGNGKNGSAVQPGGQDEIMKKIAQSIAQLVLCQMSKWQIGKWQKWLRSEASVTR